MRPSYGAHTEISTKGLAFYFNGMLSNKSSLNDNWISWNEMLEGMIVLDLNTQTVGVPIARILQITKITIDRPKTSPLQASIAVARLSEGR